MKRLKAINTVTGLIYDDPWLFFGIVSALLLSRVLISVGVSGVAAGIALTLLLFAAMVVSILREVRRSMNKT